MSKEVFKNESKELKEFAEGKSSKDCTFEERVKVSRRMGGLSKMDNETSQQHLARVNAFRCGW